jgi:hypothetical protein
VGVAKTLAVLILVVCLASPAAAQRTRFDGLRQCERHAGSQFRRHNPQYRRFIIDRSSVITDRFADKVGSQFVSTIYHGKALYEAGSGATTVPFVCLHAGVGRGPVFVYTLPQ